MSDLSIRENRTIVIKKNKGITHALKKYVTDNPNSIMSDGKITAKEWNATLDKLIEINNQRKANNQKPIFTGGTDKSRAGWHSSFVVHPNQKIEFTADEMGELLTAMGVTFKNANEEKAENKKEQSEKPKTQTPAANSDSTKVKPLAAQDSTKIETIPALPEDTIPSREVPVQPADTIPAKIIPPAAQDSIKPAMPDSVKIAPAAVQDSIAQTTPADTVKGNIVSKPADASTARVSETVENAKTKSRYELSWSEIGNIGIKSAKNFVKGMFCDENGFSLKRTATTVGVIAGLALAAPAAAALGASAAVVGGVALTAKVAGLGLAGYMAYNGGKNAIQGGQKYYESTTEEEAKANMEQAMDGAVELAAALPAFLTIKGGANKGNKMAAKKGEAKPSASETPAAEPKPATETKPSTEVKPAVEQPQSEYEFDFRVPEEKIPTPENRLPQDVKPEVEIKPSEEAKIPAETPAMEPPKSEPAQATEVKPAPEVKPAEEKAPEGDVKPQNVEKPVNYNEISGKPEILNTNVGGKIERFKNANGDIVKDVSYDKNGKLNYTLENRYGTDGTQAGYRIEWADGKIDEFISGSNQGLRTYPNGEKYNIRREGSKVVQGEQIKPQQTESQTNVKPTDAQAAEVKPAQEKAPKAEAEPAATETSQAKPAQEASKAENGYNKAVRSEIEKSSDGGTTEYFYNKAGNIIKTIKKDKSGKFEYEQISEYNSQGQQTKRISRNGDNDICEDLYENGQETKKTWKWADGSVEELTPVGNEIYEGVRTYPDGRKVKIRQEDFVTRELEHIE